MSELINNGQDRIDTLKGVIKGLHEGADPAAVKARLKALVKETTSDEIVGMEQQLMDEGMPVEEVKRMCDMHLQVVREVLTSKLDDDLPAGHPVALDHLNLVQAPRGERGHEDRMVARHLDPAGGAEGGGALAPRDPAADLALGK